MDTNYTMILLIDILILLQGVTLGVVLLIINYRRSKSAVFLGLFILVYSLEYLPDVFQNIGMTRCYPKLAYLPICSTWLLFPLFYTYVKKISILTVRSNYWELYPGIISLIFQFFIFLLPEKLGKQIYDHWFYIITEIVGILFSLWIGILTIKWIKKNKKEVQNQFSQTQYKELIWARLYVIFGLLYTITGFFFVFIESYIIRVCFSLINLILLYWVALHGALQQRISNLTYLKVKEEDLQTDKNTMQKKITTSILINEDNSSLKKKELNDLILKLNEYLVNSEAYKKKSLTIIDVSEVLGVHPKKISTAINSICNQNFNLYVNTYRIEKAKELLKSLSSNNYSIEGIGNIVGFHSKSAFYAAFKKITKTTPSQFQKEEIV